MLVWMSIEIEGKYYNVNVAYCLEALNDISFF